MKSFTSELLDFTQANLPMRPFFDASAKNPHLTHREQNTDSIELKKSSQSNGCFSVS
jgi:hypothetical protein